MVASSPGAVIAPRMVWRLCSAMVSVTSEI
jgi:hypothetical protein